MITSYFIRKKIAALAEESAARRHRSLPLDEARALLVLCDGADRAAVEPLLEPVRRVGRQVTLCLLVPAGVTQETEEEGVVCVRAKGDLDAWGFPREPLAERVRALPADILIDVTPTDCYPLRYLALRHPARFKVGVKRPGEKGYDMALAPAEGSDTGDLLRQLLFYLGRLHGEMR